MSIEKQSTGLPEFDVHRRTTKVNLAVIIAVVTFFVISGSFVIWLANRQ